jgi:hypothetical protein
MERRSRQWILPAMSSWTDVPAWLVSGLAHLSGLVLLSIFWQPAVRGTGGSSDRPVGIALVHQTSDGLEYELQGSGGAQASFADSSPAAAAAIAALASEDGSLSKMDEILNDLTGASTGNSAAQIAGQAGSLGLAGDGSGTGATGKGNKAKTSLFGVEGTGSSFVYVFDRSDSMNVYDASPLRAAKRELINSLRSLNNVHQFQIVFYNQSPTPYRSSLQNSKGLLLANDTEKRLAVDFVQSITAIGGTEHLAALKMGIAYGPNVLFFLTDASPDQPAPGSGALRDIAARCERAGTTIHCIEFGNGPNPGDGRWIEQLAKTTGGRFRYVDVAKLDRTP